MAEIEGFVDASRATLRIEGAEARGWLQDLVTNDVSPVAPGRAVYAALLNPQGKYLFDFFIVAPPSGGEGFLLDVAADRAPALAQRLGLYRVRRKVAISEAGLGVALLWGGDPAAVAGAEIARDPRAEPLGWRLYSEDPAAALAAVGAREVDRGAYDSLRVAQAAPETGVELLPEETYILEAGFDRLHGVDFRKGCYVGQEVTARMRHKTELRKGLVRVAVEGVPPPPGTEILAEDGKVAGTLHTVVDGRGLAHLRFDRASGSMRAGPATVTRL